MSVSDKGDMQNVQRSGSRGTGLKITGIDHIVNNSSVFSFIKKCFDLVMFNQNVMTGLFQRIHQTCLWWHLQDFSDHLVPLNLYLQSHVHLPPLLRKPLHLKIWWTTMSSLHFSFSIIQFKFICITLFTMQIVAKQLYRKLRFYIIFSNSLSVVWMQRYHFFRTDPIPKILSIGRYRSNPIPAQFF